MPGKSHTAPVLSDGARKMFLGDRPARRHPL